MYEGSRVGRRGQAPAPSNCDNTAETSVFYGITGFNRIHKDRQSPSLCHCFFYVVDLDEGRGTCVYNTTNSLLAKARAPVQSQSPESPSLSLTG